MKRTPIYVKAGRQYASEMRKWRKKRKLTQEEFARAVGCSYRTAQYVDVEKHAVTITTYRRFEALKKRYEEASSGNNRVRTTGSSTRSEGSFESQASYFG